MQHTHANENKARSRTYCAKPIWAFAMKWANTVPPRIQLTECSIVTMMLLKLKQNVIVTVNETENRWHSVKMLAIIGGPAAT